MELRGITLPLRARRLHSSRVMRMVAHYVAVFACALGGCGFATRSGELACSIDDDCDSDRACQSGFCVVSDRDLQPDAGGNNTVQDAAADSTQTPDADPFEAIAAMCTTAGYTPVNGITGSLFKVVATNRNWGAAQAECKDDVAGATHLIVMSNQAEATFMATKQGWVGLSDNGTNVFVTVTGETGDVRNFDSGQPDNGGGDENCIQMRNDSHKLDDDQCNNGHAYVCECDGRASTP
jgi:hypothetical protein